MGSFDNVKRLLNEVTYNAEKSIARDKKKFDAHQAKIASGMKATMGLEAPKATEKKRSQLLKVGSKAHKAAKKVNASTDIVAVLQSLKDGYESGLITEEAFLALAKPIMEKFGSAGSVRNNPPGQPKKGEKPDEAPWGGKGPKKKKGKYKNDFPTGKTNYSPKGSDKG